MKDQVKRSVQGARPKAKNHIPGKVRTHSHTNKALKAVAINGGIKTHSKGSTGNGLSSPDQRY